MAMESQGSGDAVLGSKLAEEGGAHRTDRSLPGTGAYQDGRVCCPVKTSVALSVLGAVVYVAVAAAVFPWLEGYSILDSVYFCVVTMSTVGYGDFSPKTTAGRIFTIIWIVFGVVVVYAGLAKAIIAMVSPLTQKVHDTLARALPAERLKLEGLALKGEVTSFVVPEMESWYYAKNLLPSVILNLMLHAGGAYAFLFFEPDWTYRESLWHCLITASTVGYGDVTPKSDEGKVLAIAHIIVSVALLGELFGNVTALKEKRDAQKTKLAQLQRQLDEELLEDLIERIQEFRPAGGGENQDEISEAEFVLAMLVELEVVQWDDVSPLILKFRASDVSGNGRLGREDLKLMLECPAAQRRRVADIVRNSKVAHKVRARGARAQKKA